MSQETVVKIDRKEFIGGSDAAAILGCSRWKTPLQIWAEKTGTLEADDSESIPKIVGKALEATVRNLFTQDTGLAITGVENEYFHAKYPFLGCHVDGLIGPDEIYEGKTATAYKEKEWRDQEIPAEYMIQGLHSLGVTGKKRCHMGVLIGNHNFVTRMIERDEDLIADIIKKEVAFWNDYVLTGVMPKQIKADDKETINRLYPFAKPGTQIDLGDLGARMVEMINALKQDSIALEDQIEKNQNEFKLLMKDKEIALAGKWVVTWKDQVARRVDTKALKAEMPQVYDKFAKESTSRPFRVKEAK